MKKLFLSILITTAFIPSVAFAAWWNPISWSVWSIFKPTPKVQQAQIATTTPATPTATTTEKAKEEANAKTSGELSKQKIKTTSTPIKPQKSATSNESSGTGNITTGQPTTKSETANEISTALVVSDIKPYDIPIGVPFVMTVYGAVFQNNADVELNGFPLGHFTLTSQGTLEKSITITDSRVFDVAGQSSFKVINPNGVSGTREMTIFHHDGVAKARLDSDKTPPWVSLSRIVNMWKSSTFFKTTDGGFTLYGTVGIEQDWDVAKDPNSISGSGLTTLEFFVDGISIGKSTTDAERNNKIAFDTTKFTNGEHTLSVTAKDIAGNVSSASVQIYVKN